MFDARRRGAIAVILSASGFAFLPTFTRTIYRLSELQPTDVAMWRFILATPIIWLLILGRERMQSRKALPEKLPVKKLLPMGVLYAAFGMTTMLGLRYIPASLFIVLFYTYPAMVAVIALLIGNRLPLVAWFALGLTLIGVFLTLPDFSLLTTDSLWGIFWAMMNALLVAIYFLAIGRVMSGAKSVVRGSAWVITGAMLAMFLAIPFYGFAAPPNLQVALLLIGMATVSTAMPIFMINVGIHAIGMEQASIISAIEPVLSMLLALVVLGETIISTQWVGAAFIVSAVILLEARPRKHPTLAIQTPD